MISDNKDKICSSNMSLFRVWLNVGVIICAVLFALSCFLEVYSNMHLTYVIFLIISCSVSFIIRHISGKKILLVYYLFYGAIVGYAAYSSAFVTPDYVGIFILVFLFVTPVLVLDKTLRLTVYEFAGMAVYLAIVIPHKDSRLIADEIVNSLSFFTIGSVTGYFFRKSRLRSIDLSRRLDIERTTDVLTGLPNRRMLFEFIEKLEGKPGIEKVFGLAMVDIDNFKQYNDSYGHLAGDKCLNELGKCFRSFGEKNSVRFYRYGGEEFIALVFKKPEKGLVSLFEELNGDVAALGIKHPTLPGGILTVSVGVVEIEEPSLSISFEQKIDCADKALYEMKLSGKGRTALY